LPAPETGTTKQEEAELAAPSADAREKLNKKSIPQIGLIVAAKGMISRLLGNPGYSKNGPFTQIPR
jgi:hypothetical protein